jgi:hypothetical protein
MKIIVNEKLVKRNRLIGQVTTIASLVVLGIGLYISFTDQAGNLISVTFGALLFGFLLSQIGIYFGNRWGRSPRPDERLSASLKGLDDRYTLYHYATPVSHLLLGPAGAVVLLPYQQGGKIIFNTKKNKWEQKGGNFYLKIFGQESLGRPDLEVNYSLQDMGKFFAKNNFTAPEGSVQAVLVFTNEKADVEASEAPVPTLTTEKLKDWIRRRTKEAPLGPETIKAIGQLFPQE